MDKGELYREYAKCLTDPVYFVETYLSTKTTDGYVPFKLFERQKETLRSYQNHRFTIILKPRQAGISVTTAAYITWKAVFASKENPEMIYIISKRLEHAVKFMNDIKRFMSQLPEWFGFMANAKQAEKWTEKQIRLYNGSEIMSLATSEDAVRGFTPTLLIMDEAAHIEDGVKVWTAAQPSLSTGGGAILISCVTDNTFVFTDKGIKQVKDFIKKDKVSGYFVNEYSILGKDKLRKGNVFFNNGYVNTLEIVTKHSHLEGSEEHKLWSFSKKEKRYDWFKLKELNVGDYIAMQYGMEVWGNNDDVSDFKPTPNKRNKNRFQPKLITPDIAYFLGLFIAEGNVYKKIKNNKFIGGSITITCGDNIGKYINKIGLKYSSHDGLHHTISSKELYEFLEYLGFDLTLKAKAKIIPTRLLEMSRINIIYLIRGIFDGDGYSRKDRGTVGIGLASKELIEQLRIILNNFGILTDYQTVVSKPTSKVKVESISYRISLSAEFSKIFYDKIGFNFKRKQNIQNKILKYNLKRNNSYDIIPDGVALFRNHYYGNKLSLKTLKEKKLVSTTVFENETESLSRKLMIKFYDYINVKNENISKSIKWVEIKAINKNKNFTYDFSLPHINEDKWSHSIIYNGIIGHQTPNGLDELYYKTYKLAEEKKNAFNIVRMNWWEDPRYTKDLKWVRGEEIKYATTYEEKLALLQEGYKPTSTWYEDMCNQLNRDDRMIAQELNVSFLGSGGNVIGFEYIEHQEKLNVKSPIRSELFDNNMWIWEDPIEGHQYICSVDVARGDGQDYSSIQIIDCTTNTQVAEYQGKIPPDILADFVQQYSLKYNAYTVIDITGGYGITTILKLLEQNFPKKLLHYDNPRSKLLSERKDLGGYRMGDKIPGFNIGANRILIIQEFERQIRSTEFVCRSQRLVNEMKTYIYDKMGRPDHQQGYNDDLLIGCAMGLFVFQTSFKNLERVTAMAKAMIDAMANTHSEKAIPRVTDPKYHAIRDQANQYAWLFSKPKQ